MKDCQNGDCDYFFSAGPDETYHKCVMCNYEFCIKCQLPWHWNEDCDAYQKRIEKERIELKRQNINDKKLPEDDQLI